MKKITGLLTTLIVVNSVSVWGAEPSRFKQCEIDLCGVDQSYERIRGEGAFSLIDNETRTVLDNEVIPQLNELMEYALDNKKTEYKLAESFLSRPTVELNSANRAYLTVTTYITKIEKEFWNVLTSSDGITNQVSAVKLQEKFPDLPSAKVFQMVSVLNAYLGSESYYLYNLYSRYDFDLYMKTAGSRANGDVKNARVLAEALVKELGPIASTQVDIALLRKYESGAKLAAHEKFTLMNSLGQAYRLQAMIMPEVRAVTDKLKLTYAEAVNFVNWNDKLKNTKELLANAEKMQKQKEAVLLSCEQAIAGALSAVPSELRQRKTDELLEMVKQASLDSAPLYFSGEALAKVRSTVEATKFTKPLNRTDARALALGTLTGSLNKAKSYKATLAAETKNTSGKALAWRSLIESSKAGENVFYSVEQACDRLKPKIFVDAAAPWLNQVISGWQTNMFPEIGLGILAHELGHIISGAAKTSVVAGDKRGFNEVRTCAVTGHAKLAGSTFPSNFGQYAEEDWADAFASRVIMNIGSKWPYVNNYSCSLIHATDEMDELELQSPGGLGTHSSSFLRALQTQTQLGLPLPQSCLSVMTDVEKDVVTRSCAK